MRALIASTNILREVNFPKDVRSLDLAQLQLLCDEIRVRIIDVTSKKPGHLGASLGAVELAVGIHKTFNTPEDKLIWDVGHQSYAHKILTGRNDLFDEIRQHNGISGFPKITESPFDSFGTGHSSTSISAALGMAIANQKSRPKQTHIAVIGDGSLTGGMAFEALNHLSTTNANVLVIINDNDMSIDPNVGGLQKHLNSINQDQNIFTDIGLKYFGPFEGNKIDAVVKELALQKNIDGPRVIHFKTQKGFGYNHSQQGNATHWHAPGKFAIETGQGEKGASDYPKTYQHIVGESLCKLANSNEDIYVITPAMASGSKLKEFEKSFPNRFFDVGIAEQHAVTFSAGIATQGKLPFCVVYSTFLQRGYDQLIHDVALQNLKVVFLIDRSGLVGNDGGTHHGVFDLAFLNCIPNMTLLAPANEEELSNIIAGIPSTIQGPIAIRYPRGKGTKTEAIRGVKTFEIIKEIEKSGSDKTVISIGGICDNVTQALSKSDQKIDHYALQQVKPLPVELLKDIFRNNTKIYLIEDGVKAGGISQSILSWANENNLSNKIKILALPDQFIEHGSQEELYEENGLSPEKIHDWLVAD